MTNTKVVHFTNFDDGNTHKWGEVEGIKTCTLVEDAQKAGKCLATIYHEGGKLECLQRSLTDLEGRAFIVSVDVRVTDAPDGFGAVLLKAGVDYFTLEAPEPNENWKTYKFDVNLKNPNDGSFDFSVFYKSPQRPTTTVFFDNIKIEKKY